MRFKYEYTGKTKYVLDFQGHKRRVWQIVARKDFVNKATGVMVYAGDLGGFVPLGTLSQADTSWVDQKSIVASSKRVTRIEGDAYLQNSRVAGYVNISGNAMIKNSILHNDAGGELHITENAAITESVISGTGMIAGRVVVEKCKLRGPVLLDKTEHLVNSEINSVGNQYKKPFSQILKKTEIKE